MSTATIEYLKSLKSIRARASLLLDNPEHLKCFDLNLSKLPSVADDIVNLIKRDYASPSEIPPHSRWRHFEAGQNGSKIDRIGSLTSQWRDSGVEKLESVRRLLDLFVVGVLLDAGAGSKWKYTPKGEAHVYNRSEGLGIASFDLFASGILSADPKNLHQCDSEGLQSFTPPLLRKAFQVSESNPLVGLEGRCLLLQRLGKVLESKPEYFKGPAGYRPGYLLDFLLQHSKTEDGKTAVDINRLWDVVVNGLSGIWPPTRTMMDGVSLGDVWPSEAMKSLSKTKPNLFKEYPGSESFICFHKLSQWLTYSLMEPLALADIKFTGAENMTGLAEYRNGGLFVDAKVISLKETILSSLPKNQVPEFQVWDDVIVEWRALTVALIDKIAILVRERLNMTAEELPLAKVLEAGTWKAGREIAAKLRPDTKGPPISVVSDGTVF